jgi:hypothetical protein
MPATPQQLSFTRGEWSPDGWYRYDLEGHDSACRIMHNVFPKQMGGAMNRQGTMFLNAVKTSSQRSRLVPFIFSTQQAYALEFGNQYVRFYANVSGSVGQVVCAPAAYVSTTAYATGMTCAYSGAYYVNIQACTGVLPTNTSYWYALSANPGGQAIYELPTPYAYGDLPLLKWDQSADTLFLVHPSYPPATLTRTYSGGNTQWTYSPITFGSAVSAPTSLATTSGSNLQSPTNFAISSAGTGASTQLMVAAVNSSGTEGPTSAILVAPNGSTLSWSAVTNASGYNIYALSVQSIYNGVNGNGTCWMRVTNSTTTTSTSYTLGLGNYYNGYPLIVGNPTPSFVVGNSYYLYCITAVDSLGRESLPSNQVVSSNTATLSWTGITGATKYNIYQQSVGVWGFIGSSSSSSFSLVPPNGSYFIPDTSKGIPLSENPFSGSGNYPGVVAFYQNRLWYARTNNSPQTLWGSRTGDYNNFNISTTTVDSDSVQFTINSRRVNEIKALIPGNMAMLVHTSGGVWAMTGSGGPGSNSAITPTSIDLIQQDYLYGTNDCKPISVGNNAVYADHSGGRFRDITYSIYVYGYAGTEIGIRAQHLFPVGLSAQEWDYQVYPYSIAWIIRSDGTLLGLSYQKEMNAVNLLAWHWHTTQGSFESVASVPNAATGQTDVFFIVNRSLNGSTVRCVEYLPQREPLSNLSGAWFLDCAAQYSGSPTNTVSGLNYLANMTVSVLADGVPYAGLTVSPAGVLTLPNGLTASVILAGLPYTCELMPMQFEYQTPLGTVQDKTRQIRSVYVGLKDTAQGALCAAPSNIKGSSYPANYPWLQPFDFTYEEMNGQGINPVTGLFSGNKECPLEPGMIRDGTLYLCSTVPLPWTVQRIVARMEEGER